MTPLQQKNLQVQEAINSIQAVYTPVILETIANPDADADFSEILTAIEGVKTAIGNFKLK